MNSTKRFANVPWTTVSLLSKNKTQVQEWIVASSVSRCHFCQLRLSLLQNHRTPFLSSRFKKRTSLPFHSFQPLVVLSSKFGTAPKENETQTWTISDAACPQGIQGDIDKDSATFNLWLESCRSYGLENCDQQLQGIQSGRKTIAEVIAEQDKLIADIAAEYRKQNAERRQASSQAVQETEMVRLPDINTPCPQGIQGEDCARFKLWLQNCHQFRFGNCQDQLDNYTEGRVTLTQLFQEQDRMIREAAQATYEKRAGDDNHQQSQTATATDGKTEGVDQQTSPPKPLTSGQKLKNAVAVYGSTVMVFHVSISLMSLGFFYTLVSSGIDVVGILGKLGIGETILQSKLATGTGTFVVAYAVHKVFAPARIAATLTCTPLIVRYLRQIGFLKTPQPKK